MDAATKLALLYRDFGQYVVNVGTEFLLSTYYLPAPTFPDLLRRLAELDISELDAIQFGELRPNKHFIRIEDIEFEMDRTLVLSEAFAFGLANQQPNYETRVRFMVANDLPYARRAWILSNKPSIEAVITPAGDLHVPHVTSAQPVMDLIWFHTRLHRIRADDGDTLDLSGVPRRFDQLMQATAYIHQVLATRPAASFEVTGELLKYESPLPPEDWLLPDTATS
jgi:hypothetical protein